MLVAADGRNSTVARLCNLLPRGAKERIALQTHLPLPRDFGDRVVLQFLPEGYSGQAPVGDGQLNLCLVSTPNKISALRHWAEARFGISREHAWRTITPLTRAPIAAADRSLFLVGDAARVVEPFTGEGIYYALASGELAAKAIISQHNGRGRRKLRPPTPRPMPSFIADGFGSIGSRERRSCLRASPRRFWKWRDSNQPCSGF